MKRIVFILPIPPSSDFASKFFIHELEAAGFDVNYFDVDPLIGAGNPFRSDPSGMKYQRFSDLAEFKRALSELKPDIIVPQISPSLRSFRLLSFVKSLHAPLVFFGRGYLPSVSEKSNYRAAAARIMQSSAPLDTLRQMLVGLIYRSLPKGRKFDLTFTAGEVAERIHAADTTRCVPVHHFDIDRALLDDGLPRLLDGRYAVVLDEFLPHHPDFPIQGRVNSKEYYSQINATLAAVEQALGLQVVIAAHPKATYESNPFDGRRVIWDETALLVRDADLVITHASTATAYAVINRKPIMLLRSEAIRQAHPAIDRQTLRTAEMLGCSVVTMTGDFAAPATVPKVNNTKYDAFRHEFLSTRDDHATSSATVIGELSQLP